MKRLLIYDESENSFVGLTWKAGAKLLSPFFNVVVACKSIEGCIRQLDCLNETFDQVQFWGHGSSGNFYVNGQKATRELFQAIGKRTNAKSVLWLRVCSYACGAKGKLAMQSLAAILGCKVYAHTHIIGTWGCQSGLYSVTPGANATWNDSEGMGRDGRLKSSSPFEPKTVLATRVDPPKWA